MKAVVIGAGFGGLAAAARLRARGYDVVLVEKLGKPGGRACVFERNGFVFDAGPTVVTAAFLFDELFALFNKKREDYIRFVPLYPWYRIQFADGSFFDYGGTIEQTLEQIRKFDPADCNGYLRMLEHTKEVFRVAFVKLGDKPFLTLWSMLRAAPQMVRLGAWRTVWQLACKYVRNHNLRRVFSFHPLLVGGNPFNTTSIYSLIHYLERQWGVHFAMGGTGAIIRGLETLLREEGVEIRLNTEVKEILVETGQTPPCGGTGFQPVCRGTPRHQPSPRTTGVRLADGSTLPADLVVCNADAPFAHKHLIAPQHRRKWTDRRLDKLKYSMGVFVLYFGTRRKYPTVQHHTIIFGRRYRELLREMFDEKKLEMEDVSVYLHRPTATDPSLAPEGCDAFYVLCPVPNLQGTTDWKTMGPKYRDMLVQHLERVALPGLSECICEESYVTPEFYRDELLSLHGTGFSIQPTFGQSAWFRFHNRSEDIPNLYFVGAGTHPGAGMPGVLCSAKALEYLLPMAEEKMD
ncbi:MAG: phytoene desaturase family protein [Tepidisphaeraceae bacterium]|jgi:phytoene desaturase